MKKINLLFFALLFFFNSYSQTRVETYKNCFGYYNYYSKQFDLGDYHYANITFTFYPDYISADDNAHSVYRIIRTYPEEIYSGYRMTTIQCLDEKNRDCKVSLVKYNDGSLSVDLLYDDRGYIYVVKNY